MNNNTIGNAILMLRDLPLQFRIMVGIVLIGFVAQIIHPHPLIVVAVDFCAINVAIRYRGKDPRCLPILWLMTLFCAVTLVRWGTPTDHTTEIMHWHMGRIHFVVIFGFVIALWANYKFPSELLFKHAGKAIFIGMAFVFIASLPIVQKLDHPEQIESVSCEKVSQGTTGPLCFHPILPTEHVYPAESRYDDALLSLAAGILIAVLLSARDVTFKATASGGRAQANP
ncbi:hypothetical protein [Noviherbaspirillum pedocola]|uniref:Uncharacterized protein n=1 Tax=Noviherbaspirillum pedocola TaxID=2801341 RepID=A0A934W8M5_9BURK|nr:hypothetical protein [Noviherbaspirillum pedocola]MBK4735999.1 hypothetical protein [Noviherbaspirillum pedocola]